MKCVVSWLNSLLPLSNLLWSCMFSEESIDCVVILVMLWRMIDLINTSFIQQRIILVL